MRHTAARTGRRAALVLALALLSGCMGFRLEDILTGLPMGGDVRGEVAWVDERSREIGVSGSWGGRETVRYDSRTRVIYRQREYRVRDLERGDLVSIELDSDSRSRRYARTIRVESDGRDSRRGGRDGRRDRF